MSRVNPQTQDDLPEEYRYLLDEDAMGEINLLCTMANNPDLLQSYMRYGTTLWTESGLDPADVERCILAVARALDASYEWNQHVPLAREQDVPDDEIRAIGNDRLDALAGREEALTAYAQSVAIGDVDDAVFAAAAEYLDDRTITGVTLLATHYLATARFLEALAVPLDEEFVGWTPDS